MGLFNTSKLPVNPGVYAAFGLMYSGIVFLEAYGSSTLAAIPMEKKGNYSQLNADISAGFWVPFVICSFNYSVQNFALREEPIKLIEDRLIRYYFRADAFTKNFPYTVKVDIGFQNLKRSYSTMSIVGSDIVISSQTDEFKSIFIGFEGSFSVNQSLKFMLGAEMPVYSWAVSPMKAPPKDIIFFEFRAGMIWTLNPVNKRNNQYDNEE